MACLFFELLLYSVIVGDCVNSNPTLLSISDCFARDVGLNSYYIVVILLFVLERNLYECWDFCTASDRVVSVGVGVRALLMNLMMMFLLMLGAISNVRDEAVHNTYALAAIVCHLLLEVASIALRFYQDWRSAMEVLCICTEIAAAVAAVIFALLFIGVIPANQNTAFVSEYMLFAIVVSTPVYRLLDQ